MLITNIVDGINELLAGEQLTYSQLLIYMDSVIDDINNELDSCFPSFTEFEENKDNYENYPNYNFFPDKYIRSCVMKGAAYKFYVTDEEGIATAQQYAQDYQTALFYMLRDYVNKVPCQYRAAGQGYIRGHGSCTLNNVCEDNVRDLFLGW